ncbi:MAG: hypothetical protein Q9169_007448 [Polycauliona sp. 2 TL-2023]
MPPTVAMQRKPRRPSAQRDKATMPSAKRPQGIRKSGPPVLRRSPRLQKTHHGKLDRIGPSLATVGIYLALASDCLADQGKAPKKQPDPLDRPSSPTKPKKRKRDQDPVQSSALLQTPHSSKRHQASIPSRYPTDKESPAPAPSRSHDQSPLKPPQISSWRHIEG